MIFQLAGQIVPWSLVGSSCSTWYALLQCSFNFLSLILLFLIFKKLHETAPYWVLHYRGYSSTNCLSRKISDVSSFFYFSYLFLEFNISLAGTLVNAILAWNIVKLKYHWILYQRHVSDWEACNYWRRSECVSSWIPRNWTFVSSGTPLLLKSIFCNWKSGLCGIRRLVVSMSCTLIDAPLSTLSNMYISSNCHIMKNDSLEEGGRVFCAVFIFQTAESDFIVLVNWNQIDI